MSLSDEEYFQVAKAAKKEKKSPGQMIAETVRVWIRTEGA